MGSTKLCGNILKGEKNGATLPSVELIESTPLTRVNVNEICKNKKILLFSVVGAYIPGCSSTHLASFLKKNSEIKKKGFHEIIGITVNDFFVTETWAKENRVEDKIRILADPNADFAKATGLEAHFPILGVRSKGFAMVVINNVIKQIVVEQDDTGTTCLVAEKLIL